MRKNLEVIALGSAIFVFALVWSNYGWLGVPVGFVASALVAALGLFLCLFGILSLLDKKASGWL